MIKLKIDMPLALHHLLPVCVRGSVRRFILHDDSFGRAIIPPLSPHISSNQMDVHPWEERISTHLDVQPLYDSSIIMLI